jgi:hypothetical protein
VAAAKPVAAVLVLVLAAQRRPGRVGVPVSGPARLAAAERQQPEAGAAAD